MDRQQLEALLANRFPGTTQEQIAAAANAIMAMIRAAGNPAIQKAISRKNTEGAAASPLRSRGK